MVFKIACLVLSLAVVALGHPQGYGGHAQDCFGQGDQGQEQGGHGDHGGQSEHSGHGLSVFQSGVGFGDGHGQDGFGVNGLDGSGQQAGFSAQEDQTYGDQEHSGQEGQGGKRGFGGQGHDGKGGFGGEGGEGGFQGGYQEPGY